MAKRIFHQVMLTFKVPKDPPLEISCPEVIVDNPVVIGSYVGFMIKDTDYAT